MQQVDGSEFIRLTRAAEGVHNSRPSKARRWKRRFGKILDRISLATYIAWINDRDYENAHGMALVSDLDHWAGYGITTARQLGAYLDACCAEAVAEYERDQYRGDDAYAAEWDATNNL